MLAVEISTPGPPEVLKPVERPDPVPRAGEVLIRVAAAGVNRPDVLQRRGAYPPPPGASDLPGLEVAGVIEVARRRRVPIGASAIASARCVSGGGYATLCAAPAAQCLPVPAAMDLVTAAAIPETFFTVWTNVFDRGRLAGRRDGALPRRLERHRHDGHPACRRARRASARDRRLGREVPRVRTARRRARDQLPLGGFRRRRQAGDGWPRRRPDSRHRRRRLHRARPGRAGDRRPARRHRLHGRRDTATIDFRRILGRRLTITGSDAAPAQRGREGTDCRRAAQEVWPLLESGAVKPVVYQTFPLA